MIRWDVGKVIMSKIGNKVEETLIKGYKNNYNSFKKIIDMKIKLGGKNLF